MLHDVINQPLSDMQRALDEHSKRNAIVDINTRQATSNQRDKDRQFRIKSFANKMAPYHAGDIFARVET